MGPLDAVAAPFWLHCAAYELRRAVRAYERRRTRIASQRVIQGGKSIFGLGASVQQTAIVCGIHLYGGVYILGLLYPVAGFFTGSADQRTGIVCVVLVCSALAALYGEMNSRREFENAILRYINDNAFSDFGAFRPVRPHRPVF